MNKAVVSIVSLAVAVAVSACSSTGSADGKRSMTNAEKGALIGVLSGAAIGAASSKKRGKGALIGAVGGGLAGTAVGHYMDRQKQDLEKSLQSERDSGAVKIEKLPGDVVKITMTSQTAFDSGSAALKAGFVPTMDRLAKVVVQYEKTELTVIGHTDSEGSTQSNQELSQRRAHAVTDYLQGKNVNPERLDAIGKGETEPVDDNRTDAGRRANRRVEILVEPVRAE